MNNILIIGCGLLGSSLLRRIHKKKIVSKIFIYEKSKKSINKFTFINICVTFINNYIFNYDSWSGKI